MLPHELNDYQKQPLFEAHIMIHSRQKNNHFKIELMKNDPIRQP